MVAALYTSVLAKAQDALAAAPDLGDQLHVPLTLDQRGNSLPNQGVVVYAENADGVLFSH